MVVSSSKKSSATSENRGSAGRGPRKPGLGRPQQGTTFTDLVKSDMPFHRELGATHKTGLDSKVRSAVKALVIVSVLSSVLWALAAWAVAPADEEKAFVAADAAASSLDELEFYFWWQQELRNLGYDGPTAAPEPGVVEITTLSLYRQILEIVYGTMDVSELAWDVTALAPAELRITLEPGERIVLGAENWLEVEPASYQSLIDRADQLQLMAAVAAIVSIGAVIVVAGKAGGVRGGAWAVRRLGLWLIVGVAAMGGALAGVHQLGAESVYPLDAYAFGAHLFRTTLVVNWLSFWIVGSVGMVFLLTGMGLAAVRKKPQRVVILDDDPRKKRR